MSKKSKVIFWSSFNHVDTVTLCINEKEYNKQCKKLGYDYSLEGNDGICTLFVRAGKCSECVIGIKTIDGKVENILPLIAHEIVHAVDFIMEEDGIKDMEFRAYAVQDMLAKSILYLQELKVLK